MNFHKNTVSLRLTDQQILVGIWGSKWWIWYLNFVQINITFPNPQFGNIEKGWRKRKKDENMENGLEGKKQQRNNGGKGEIIKEEEEKWKNGKNLEMKGIREE